MTRLPALRSLVCLCLTALVVGFIGWAVADQEPSQEQRMIDPGKIQPVRADANPQTRSVAEARRLSKPERLSPMLAPEPFDRDTFAADPRTYLDTIEPGRVYQTAQPAADVPRLKVVGFGFFKIRQGESVELRVEATPLAPVTFTSFDAGAFENQLPSITVRAGDDGIATVGFYGTSGTFGDIDILAGCPLASGQARFKVEVDPRP